MSGRFRRRDFRRRHLRSRSVVHPGVCVVHGADWNASSAKITAKTTIVSDACIIIVYDVIKPSCHLYCCFQMLFSFGFCGRFYSEILTVLRGKKWNQTLLKNDEGSSAATAESRGAARIYVEGSFARNVSGRCTPTIFRRSGRSGCMGLIGACIARPDAKKVTYIYAVPNAERSEDAARRITRRSSRTISDDHRADRKTDRGL